jgi:flagellin
MGLRINQNVAAQNAYRSLAVTDSQMSRSLEKLSSGFRINRAADDAAGLAISEGLRSQVGGLKVAVRNAQDGNSVVQTAEGALNEVHAILQRMRDLSVQAGNDSNNATTRTNISNEVTSLRDELTRISSSTNFNGTKLLDGSVTDLKFQIGADGNADSQVTVNLTNISNIVDNLGAGGTSFAIANTAGVINGNGGTITFDNGDGTEVEVDLSALTTAGGSTVEDVVDSLNANVNFSTNFSATLTTNAAGAPTGVLVTSKVGGTVASTAGSDLSITAGAGTAVPGMDLTDAAGAQQAVTDIDTAIGLVSNARAEFGSYQNRLEHTINNLNVAIENLSASESRIRDTDMAQEMMSFTRAQILSQAGTAMLAQANQVPQGVLQLLR